MSIIDPRFLQVHPATRQWWSQRKQCERCAHCDASVDRDGATVMRCKLLPAEYVNKWQIHGYCIDARLPNQPCGPGAALFKEKPSA